MESGTDDLHILSPPFSTITISSFLIPRIPFSTPHIKPKPPTDPNLPTSPLPASTNSSPQNSSLVPPRQTPRHLVNTHPSDQASGPSPRSSVSKGPPRSVSAPQASASKCCLHRAPTDLGNSRSTYSGIVALTSESLHWTVKCGRRVGIGSHAGRARPGCSCSGRFDSRIRRVPVGPRRWPCKGSGIAARKRRGLLVKCGGRRGWLGWRVDGLERRQRACMYVRLG